MPDLAAPSLILRLFGPFEALLDGAPLPGLRRRQARWLLALLALRAGREVERAWLAGLLWPENAEDRRALLDVFLLEKALYEIEYELTNRPAWAAIPMDATLRILNERGVTA